MNYSKELTVTRIEQVDYTRELGRNVSGIFRVFLKAPDGTVDLEVSVTKEEGQRLVVGQGAKFSLEFTNEVS